MFRSIVLTSPTIATVGMALCIPIALCVDIFFHWDSEFVLDWYSGMGAFACLLGFVCVNVGRSDGEKVINREGHKESADGRSHGDNMASIPGAMPDSKSSTLT